MIVIAVIEDQWQDLLKVCANFLVNASAEIQVKPYLIAVDSERPGDEDIAYLQGEVSHYHPSIKFPQIRFLSALAFSESEQCRTMLAQLATDDVDVIVSDSQIGEDEVAGLSLLGSALTEEGFAERNWTCHLMTKQHTSLSKWMYALKNGRSDSRIGYLDKNPLLRAFPDQCADVVTELVEREIATRLAAKNIRGKKRFGCFIGGSKKLNDGPNSPYVTAHLANEMDGTVLITGEPGAGKDVLARALHEESERKNHVFVAIAKFITQSGQCFL